MKALGLPLRLSALVLALLLLAAVRPACAAAQAWAGDIRMLTGAQAQLGPSDAIGRYGGEEFVVILNGLHGDGARAVANRILEQVAQLSVWDVQLVARADAAVYETKRLGRNRVQMAPALA